LAYRSYHQDGGGSVTTALRYSLDECQTWSSAVTVDAQFGGAYPSIVDLIDGTELIAYYEEGAGSTIRLKRFRVTNDGVEWLPVQPLHAPEPKTVSMLLTGVLALPLVHVSRSRWFRTMLPMR
jgi:hypothetical protein